MLGASLLFWAKKSKTQHPLKKREYFVTNILFSKKNSEKKNHKLFLKENIATIITTTD